MIIDDLYIAIRDRLMLAPSLGIKTIDWFNGQPDEWENGAGKMDPLKLPCVLVRYEPPQWKARGRKHYEAEGVIYLDIVQRVVDEPLGSHRRAEKVQKRRDSYAIVQAIGKRLVGMRGVGYGTFGLIGMEQDHSYSKLRVDTIAFRSLLCSDMDPVTWTPHEVPDLVIDANPPMEVVGPVARVRNTNDTETIATIPEGEDYALPQVAVPYVQADGTLAEFYASIMNLVSGFLRLVLPGGGAPPVPRFTVYEPDGITVHAYRDILSPSYTLPGGGVCAPATYQLKDSADNPIGPPGNIASGGNADIIAPDAGVSVNGTQITTVKSNDAYDVAVKDFDGEPVGEWSDLLEAHVIGDAKVQVNGVGVLTEVRPESESNEVEVVDTDEAIVGSLVSGQWRIADSVLTKPDGTTLNLRAQQPFDIRTLRSGIAYQFGMILHYGNPTSYRTGDEGDMLANGFFDYERPLYPVSYAKLVNNTTLASNNFHGNTNRFTDRSGGQTYADDIVQDHFQGVEIYRALQTAATWNNAIDGAVALSIGGDTDWRVTPMRVLLTVMNGAAGAGANFLNFAPFSISNTNYWTSTTQAFSTANAFRVASGQPVTTAKTNTNAWLACRRFI